MKHNKNKTLLQVLVYMGQYNTGQYKPLPHCYIFYSIPNFYNSMHFNARENFIYTFGLFTIYNKGRFVAKNIQYYCMHNKTYTYTVLHCIIYLCNSHVE